MEENFIGKFENDLKEISKLITVPSAIQDAVLDALGGLEQVDLNYTGQIKMVSIKGLIRSISTTTLESQYKIIYNQVCVLACSALSSIMEDIFIFLIKNNYTDIDKEKVKEIDIKLGTLIEFDFNTIDNLGEIIKASDRKINFQDPLTVFTACKQYLNKDYQEILCSEIKKNIIFYIQCRHCIVHENSKINRKALNILAKYDANLKNFKLDDPIILNNNDWRNIKISFKALTEVLFYGETKVSSDELIKEDVLEDRIEELDVENIPF